MENLVVQPDRRNWQRVSFFAVVVITILVLGGLFGGVLAGVAPFASPGEGPGYDFPESHRWHDTQWGAFLGILVVGGLVSLLWKPERKPLVMQFIVVVMALFALLSVIGGRADNLVMLIPIALVAALYPARDRLLAFDMERGWNPALLALTAAVAVVLAPEAWDKLQLQLDHVPGDEHAEFGHWAGSALLLAGYAAAGILAASRRPGYRHVGLLGGASLIYLGVGAVVMPDDKPIVATWSSTAGLLSILAGVGFIAAIFAWDRLRAPGAIQSRPAAVGDSPEPAAALGRKESI